jgi:hypothetical protein
VQATAEVYENNSASELNATELQRSADANPRHASDIVASMDQVSLPFTKKVPFSSISMTRTFFPGVPRTVVSHEPFVILAVAKQEFSSTQIP